VLSIGLKNHILGTLGLAYIIFGLLQWGAGLIVLWTHSVLFAELLDVVIVITLYPLVALCQVVLYYDTRIRREGYDIEMMAAMNVAGSPIGVIPA
jgi:hypothetical protein